MGFKLLSRRFSKRRVATLVNVLALLAGSLSPAYADTTPAIVTPSLKNPGLIDPPRDPAKETLITAKQMASDPNTGIVTANGRVEIARNGYILHADKVTYNQKTGVMRAEGHVAMLAPSGEVQFSETEDVTGDMKQAFAENAGILFPDNSRMAAHIIQRYDGRYTVADKGTYTACNVCKDNPDTPPLWQLDAKQIVHDNVEHEIYYHDATIDFSGVPLFYTPYMSTPDPTVERRQGLLTTTPGVTPELGAYVRVPYYFDISPDMDATFEPVFSTKDKLQLGGEIRKRFDEGNLQFDGSFTHADLISDTGVDEGQQWRGHLFGYFLYDIDNIWRAGTNIQIASDKSYLQRYQYSSLEQLTNRAYLEGFKGRDYAVVNSYYFEDLQAGSQPVQPLVLPQSSFSAMGEPGQTFGGRWSVNGNMLVTTRDNANQGLNQQGPDTRRLYFDGGWERQFTSDTGLLTTVSGFMRADAESADNVINSDGTGNNFNNVALARQFEQANAVFRYPVGRNGDGYQQILEPIVAVTAAPNIHSNVQQPIEDSLDFQFDETNLFSGNRFTGYDLIEGGSRVTYGLRHAITGAGGQRVEMFGGQTFELTENNSFPTNSGLNDRASDYVGRIDFIPSDWFTLNYGFRLDHSTFTPQQQDALLSVGKPIFRPFIHYISDYTTDTSIIGNTAIANLSGYPTIGSDDTIVKNEEVILGFDTNFEKYWTFHVDHTQAFSPQPGARTSDATLSYADECYIFAVTLSHDDTNRVDVSSGTSVMFHMFLKNVGGVRTDSYSPNASAFPSQFRQTN